MWLLPSGTGDKKCQKSHKKCQKCEILAKKCPIVQKNVKKVGFHNIGATIRTCRESWFLPYAGLFLNEGFDTNGATLSRFFVTCSCVDTYCFVL